MFVQGETGSGKTTQVPKMIYNTVAAEKPYNAHKSKREEKQARKGMFENQLMVGVTQPRRVAAINLAQRISDEMGKPLGSTVGYRVRF
mmetsp:Transcript_31673/g.48468  ORF Transcript_31673/g.48468 Transcript_31673/m.48468 type:complete len:88 (-) Transcript_31673:1878-2141(-)